MLMKKTKEERHKKASFSLALCVPTLVALGANYLKCKSTITHTHTVTVFSQCTLIEDAWIDQSAAAPHRAPKWGSILCKANIHTLTHTQCTRVGASRVDALGGTKLQKKISKLPSLFAPKCDSAIWIQCLTELLAETASDITDYFYDYYYDTPATRIGNQQIEKKEKEKEIAKRQKKKKREKRDNVLTLPFSLSKSQ